MATEPENIECSTCGASLRPGAAFCHKCGAKFATVEQPAVVSSAWFKGDITAPEPHALAESIAGPANTGALEQIEGPKENAPEPDFPATVSDTETRAAAAETQNLGDQAAEILPIGKKMPPREFEEAPEVPSAPAAAAVKETPAAPPSVRAKPLRPLTEAAKPSPAETIRRKPKEKIEVVWERPDSGLNIGFIIGSIVIFVIVLLIVMGVYYIK